MAAFRPVPSSEALLGAGGAVPAIASVRAG
jgi:hypothetical protein